MWRLSPCAHHQNKSFEIAPKEFRVSQAHHSSSPRSSCIHGMALLSQRIDQLAAVVARSSAANAEYVGGKVDSVAAAQQELVRETKARAA